MLIQGPASFLLLPYGRSTPPRQGHVPFPLPSGHPPGRLLFIPLHATQKPLLPGSPPGLPTKVVLCTHCPGCFPKTTRAGSWPKCPDKLIRELQRTVGRSQEKSNGQASTVEQAGEFLMSYSGLVRQVLSHLLLYGLGQGKDRSESQLSGGPGEGWCECWYPEASTDPTRSLLALGVIY